MKALILCCGGSPEPLEFSIENFKTDFYYFLHSKKSIDVAQMLVEEFNLNEDQYSFKLIEDYESLEDSYAKSREVLQELQKEFSDITVDFTGGTKPMVAGLVLAAIGEDCNYIYVGSKGSDARDKQGMGIVQNGFEAIKGQKDPYEVYAVMEFNKGMEFFNKYQFTAAKLNFEEASKKLESNELKELAQTYLEIVEIYDKWDKFNNKYSKKVTINQFFESILEKIKNSNNIKKYFDESYPMFVPQMEDNLKFLNLKISKGGIQLADVPYYLPDLLNNSKRRIDEGKYDDAVARLYRLIELIGQYSLTAENVINEDMLRINSEFRINIDDIESKNNPNVDNVLLNFYEYNTAINDGKDVFGIPLKKTYQLLCAFGSDYASRYLDDKKMKSNVNIRNGSILAHGLRPVDEKKAKELYSQVLGYAKDAFPEVEKYMEMSKFPKFK